jgi:L-lysine 2,3-aminomutase
LGELKIFGHAADSPEQREKIKDLAKANRYRVYTRKQLDKIPQLKRLSPADLNAMKAVSAVLPFRVNNYVIDELIDWDNIPGDPIFQLTFPQPEMLAEDDLSRMVALIEDDAPAEPVMPRARRSMRRGGYSELPKRGSPAPPRWRF